MKYTIQGFLEIAYYYSNKKTNSDNSNQTRISFNILIQIPFTLHVTSFLNNILKYYIYYTALNFIYIYFRIKILLLLISVILTTFLFTIRNMNIIFDRTHNTNKHNRK